MLKSGMIFSALLLAASGAFAGASPLKALRDSTKYERLGLARADFNLQKTPGGGWILDRLKPSFLRHVAAEGKAAQFIVVAADRALADTLAEGVRPR